MSTFIHPAASAATAAGLTPHYLSSPENIRAIFFTNLVLLGVQEHSMQGTENTSSELLDAYRDQSNSRSGFGATSRLQHPQHILIDLHGHGANTGKPLELHRHVFAKGHQSTRALEFILWFLFTRLESSQARERFKECWPILDRHDAREFRNVAFKWLDELRKEGCFGIGHNIHSLQAQQTAGLGVFLATIRRSYLDESIGERIEQLVLVLSTYVLAHTIVHEMSRLRPTVQYQGYGRENAKSLTDRNKALFDLACAAPESARKEDTFMTMIDSHIVQSSQSFIQDMEQQRQTRLTWSTMSEQISSKLTTLTKELARIEAERRTFFAYQPQLAERTNLLSLEELQILEDRWIEKINAQWEPILGFVEPHVDRKETLRSLVGSEPRHGGSVLDGRSIQLDIPLALRHLTESGGTNTSKNSTIDLASVLKFWKRSLQTLENGSCKTARHRGDNAPHYTRSFEALAMNHGHQLDKIHELKRQLGARLKDSTRRVDRLQREQNVKQQPYRRLLSTIAVDGGYSRDAPNDLSSRTARNELQSAIDSSNTISATLKSSTGNPPSSPTRLRVIRNQVHHCVQKSQLERSKLCEKLGPRELSNILAISGQMLVTAPLMRPRSPYRSTARATDVRALKTNTPVPTVKAAQPDTTFVRSIIQPPRSIASRISARSQESSTIPITWKSMTISAKSITKPVPADLVERGRVPSVYTEGGVSVYIKPPAIVSAKSLERLGISRKRRQSSDFRSEGGASLLMSRTNVFQQKANPQAEEVIRQRELFNVFQVDQDSIPGSPSKRRRIDTLGQQLAGRRSTFGFQSEFKVPLKESANQRAGILESAVPKSPKMASKKVTRSPSLTLDDLRAPTPKAVKTKGLETGMPLPIMFLHTPQRKQLFPTAASPPPKPVRPFSPSTLDTKSNHPFASTKPPPQQFSSSIFARFKTGGDLWSSESRPSSSIAANPAAHRQTFSESSPFTVSTARTPDDASSGSPLLNKRYSRPLTTSTIGRHLFTRNSHVLDRVVKESNQSPPRGASGDESPADGICKHSANPSAHQSPSENSNKVPQAHKAMLYESVAIPPAADLKASRNPWGRPPSWKPKSPRMIDMERKRQAERALRLTAKGVAPAPLSFNSLSHSTMGSLKVSVYGRASVSVPSSSSGSFSSASLSSRSFHSDSSLQTNKTGRSSGITQETAAQEVSGHEEDVTDDNGNDNDNDNQNNNDDTQTFSPPPVSPIRLDLSESLPTFAASVFSSRPRRETKIESQFQIPTRSSRKHTPLTPGAPPITVASASPLEKFVSVKSTEASPTDVDTLYYIKSQQEEQERQQEADRNWFLEQPIAYDETMMRRQNEDETMLNYALQPIFGGEGALNVSNRSRSGGDYGPYRSKDDTRLSSSPLVASPGYGQENGGSFGGLFDEGMPDALDPDEALWENTELFPSSHPHHCT